MARCGSSLLTHAHSRVARPLFLLLQASEVASAERGRGTPFVITAG